MHEISSGLRASDDARLAHLPGGPGVRWLAVADWIVTGACCAEPRLMCAHKFTADCVRAQVLHGGQREEESIDSSTAVRRTRMRTRPQ